jgi:sugar phosphate isomerase/epimerase
MGWKSFKKNKQMIYISTGGESSNSGYESAQNYLSQGFKAVELSGGIYDKNQLKNLKKLLPNLSLQVHNYFPPPEDPFVLNLASNDQVIFKKSISHIRKAIDFAIELGRPIYSFHAGFLFDPIYSQLGKPIHKQTINNRAKTLEVFINRVKDLAEEYRESGVILLIENNVLSKRNFINFNCNPFLLVDSSECNYFMENMPENVKLLIDVAHLKVSSKTLNFCPENMLKECEKWTYAYHLSENDGITDSNSPVLYDSWFWPHIRKDLDFYVLEIYNTSEDELKKQVELVSNFIQK